MSKDNIYVQVLEVTPTAVDKIAEIIASRKKGPLAVRVSLRGQLPGGGFQSEFKFCAPEEKTENDLIQDVGPFQFYIDKATANIIEGAKVDYDESRYDAGFNIAYPNTGSEGLSKEWDDPISQSVQDAIDQHINPALAGHGGWVVLLEVKDDTAFIEMGGGCHGCALSTMTLKTGIERLVKEHVPQIQAVLDRTDHAGGTNPYYTGDPSGSSALG